jgi:hypothetical protein
MSYVKTKGNAAILSRAKYVLASSQSRPDQGSFSCPGFAKSRRTTVILVTTEKDYTLMFKKIIKYWRNLQIRSFDKSRPVFLKTDNTGAYWDFFQRRKKNLWPRYRILTFTRYKFR